MTDTAIDNPAAATPTGEPDKRSREEWLLLALVSLDGEDAADAWWDEHVVASRRGMLGLRNGWTWDAATQSFVSGGSGQVVGGAALRRQAESLADEAEHEMRERAIRMADGEVPIDQWQRRQAQDVLDLSLCIAALGCGGWRNLSPGLIEHVQGAVDGPPGTRFSIDRLFDFAHDVASGADRAGTPGAIALRASLYSHAALGLFEDVRRESHRSARDERGRRQFLYESNRLGPNENHCPECPAETARGWVPIGTLSLPGSRVCVMNCKCELTYSLAPA